ncbi:MAG: GlsB/YeaQ/YmgE family stress response membrane protein [Chloroflexi bacterium]|jgi:uncharacterized membrane protein YeaQ/YmgE (transglycosylase-associated protein family)|nr:GlsB/YeaQ/YmgE family stress response membrane protein [Chloroflexota bacterium]MDL1882578.1 GlsB/YeaQ/YmgE family stress response membrane protein [Anaerolineae bacterium CFX8]
MDPVNLIVWIIIGGVAGLIASYLVKTKTTAGIAADVVAGILGGLIGGYILRLFNIIGDPDLSAINWPSAVVAVVGAVVLLLVWEVVRRSQTS